jgi:pseudaminic acid cytidylyltransferase
MNNEVISKKVLAIIPARSGSKRIKNKNIKDFFGKPFIYYAIQIAKKSGIFDDIVVSTDSKKIIKISNKYGAETPFVRSKKLSDDYSDTISVIRDCITNLEKENRVYKYVCCIYPTNPFLEKDNLIKAYKILKSKKNIRYIFTAVKYAHPIERSFKLKKNKVNINIKKNFKMRTQDIDESYHDGAQFYFAKVQDWKKRKKIFSSQSYAIILSELKSHDIDNPIDIKLAKLKYKLIKNL